MFGWNNFRFGSLFIEESWGSIGLGRRLLENAQTKRKTSSRLPLQLGKH